jgi:two-component system, NarL family, sensor histidine kinase DegS
MKGDPYTRERMEAARSGAHGGDSRFDGLRAEATAAVGYSANTLRGIRDRYREAFGDVLARWQGLRDHLDEVDQRPRPRPVPDDAGTAAGEPLSSDTAEAAELSAEEVLVRSLRTEVDNLSDELGSRQAELAKLDLAQRTLERTWLFLERGDVTLVTDSSGPPTSGDLEMRVLEAQEAERERLAQEIHDGPAQALSNAIFQVDYIERVLPTDPALAETEIRYLRELLRRELGDVRAFISQLRPPLLEELGLDGAIEDAVARVRSQTGLAITTGLTGPVATLTNGAQTVVLRVAQEALQNVRKHASASTCWVTTSQEADAWVLEIRDDGRGFDTEAVAARGRRNFGLLFMRERAELIGARVDVRSQPDDGTVVRLVIPLDPLRE